MDALKIRNKKKGKLDDFLNAVKLIVPSVKKAAMAEYLRRI